MDKNSLLRGLPAVDDVLLHIGADGHAQFPRAVLIDAIREEIQALRERIIAGDTNGSLSVADIASSAVSRASLKSRFNLRSVINGTGVVLHTNLGRALLCEEAAEHVKQVAMSFSTLEYDVSGKRRGDRHSIIEPLLTKVTGAEAGLVVNNNAAAVMLILSALAANREVIVSRGELVEIGGSFRVPEIMELGGAILKEVGTTNRTKLADYENAIDPNVTGLILKVHTSNYKITGFTQTATLDSLKTLSEKYNLPLVYDAGSGALVDLRPAGFSDEPIVNRELMKHADIVCFSGDKLLGGPQAGIIVGKRQYIDIMKKHPLVRALRPGKLSLAALEAILMVYLDQTRALKKIPVLNMMFESEENIKSKAVGLCNSINGLCGKLVAEVLATRSAVGGGSLPGEELPSWAVKLYADSLSAEHIDSLMRAHSIPIIGRIQNDEYLLDVRTISECEFSDIICAVKAITDGVTSDGVTSDGVITDGVITDGVISDGGQL